MTSIFKSVQKHALIRSAAYILLGIAITLDPIGVSKIILNIIIAYNVVMGIFNLLSAFKNKVDGYNPTTGFAIFYFVCALLIFLFAKPIVSMLPMLLGISFIIGGAMRLTQSLSLRQYVNVNWLPMLVYGGFMIGAGILLVINPFSSAMMFFRFFGITLTISGISELIAFIRLRNVENN
ncbi:HdeD family acid-resistance protein [Vagococcus fluvialis]|uniref:DUF308 domain-containing protein n=1 Tax=Vagococcus fluvialis TaxID=2738 RepID=A0A7X6D7C0_9ENTE|nr:DUF308 domain-containing protein [Vagococcus fluvialis]NKC67099.1 hypothetical protein [Vagococcus fluvialis]